MRARSLKLLVIFLSSSKGMAGTSMLTGLAGPPGLGAPGPLGPPLLPASSMDMDSERGRWWSGLWPEIRDAIELMDRGELGRPYRGRLHWVAEPPGWPAGRSCPPRRLRSKTFLVPLLLLAGLDDDDARG